MGLGQVLTRCSVALEEIGDGVEAEAVETELEPEADDPEHRLHDLGVLVVEIGLVGVEAVPVVLLARRFPRPVGRLDVDEDDPGVGPSLVVVVPDVPVGLGVVFRRPRLDEPGMLFAGVVHHQVGDDPDTAPVGVVEKGHQVVEGAQIGVDGEEVADVVATVAHGRRVVGQEPQAVDPQPLEIVELGPQAGDIADPVVVGVEETPGEDLVEDGPSVPVGRSGGREGGGTDPGQPGAPRTPGRRRGRRGSSGPGRTGGGSHRQRPPPTGLNDRRTGRDRARARGRIRFRNGRRRCRRRRRRPGTRGRGPGPAASREPNRSAAWP